MYQWLLILIVLLFFIYNFTNVNKECFNVGANNIQISSQLFLKDVCSKKDDGASCSNDSECKSNLCYYKYDSDLVPTSLDYFNNGVNGSCIDIKNNSPKGKEKDLCLKRSIRFNKFDPQYTTIPYVLIGSNQLKDSNSASNIKSAMKILKDYKNEFFCKNDLTCNTPTEIPENINNNTALYNLCNTINNNINITDGLNKNNGIWEACLLIEAGICE